MAHHTRTTTQARRVPALWAVPLSLALALAGCASDGAGDDETVTETATETETVSPSPTDDDTASPTEEPSAPADESEEPSVPFPANTEPDTREPSEAAMLTVTDIRVGHHEDYDRVVFEMDGEGAPGWRVEYVDQPVEDGKGTAIEMDGDAYLQVMISGSGYPMDTGVEEYSEPNPVEVEDGEIEEVLLRGVFEGYTQAFIGVDDEPRPFRAFLLEDPARVVVDVRHVD
ncbi:hypothetical protein [Cellulosimicrobium sp. NPDC057127]|uniref:AMIN-like domain-containing (lipo)protein n=1 Tax=Cellulosimicrobium sp. NPDC057127 TaxID=3346026 RepID=UPI00362E0004